MNAPQILKALQPATERGNDMKDNEAAPDAWDELEMNIIASTESRYARVAQAEASGRRYQRPIPRLVGFRTFVGTFKRPEWVVENILQRGYVYALTGLWGHGKTAVMVTFALLVASGRTLGDKHRVARERVAFLCGENVADTKLRVKMTAEALGIAWNNLEGWLFFTEAPFAIDNPSELGEFVETNVGAGPFGLMILDTGPAHSEAEEENDNRQMHDFAMALRVLPERFGNPAVVTLMHPIKGATRETMQPRCGGAFSGAIDGELCVWMDAKSALAEFFHRTKFRGPGFKPLVFRLEKRELADVRDNFDNAVATVVASLTDEQLAGRPASGSPLAPTQKIAVDVLRRCLANGSGKAATVPPEVRREAKMGKNTATLFETWRQACYDARISGSEKQEARQKAFKRAAGDLQAAGLVAVHKDFVWIPDEPNHAPEIGR